MEFKQTAMQNILSDQIDLSNLVPTCIRIAQEVEKIGGMPGHEKLALLQKILREAVIKSGKPSQEKLQLYDTIDTIVPLVVQAAVLASKHPILANVQETCVSCWTKTKRS